MIQRIVGIWIFCSTILLHSQNYEHVDATISFYPSSFPDAQSLASKIVTDFSEPIEQLRAGYSWLIHNVAYDPQEYYTYKFQYRLLEERNEKMAASREGIIQRTVKEQVAVCEGYALTLERLCEHLGINAYVVRGDTKTHPSDIGRPFDKNHMWMVAVIDQTPILLDPTWGAGRYNGGFIKSPSYAYFNTPPSQFIKNHYPEVFSDAYVEDKMSKEAFSLLPLLIHKELSLDKVIPQNGVLKSKSLSKGIVFSFKDLQATQVSYSLDASEKINVDFEKGLGEIQFTIQKKTKAQSLVIYVDDQPVIGYKIKK